MEKMDAPVRERGQALVLFVLALGVLMGFTAMSVDVGLILNERRSLQNAADAAALAGVQELPGSPSMATVKALEWAENHDYTSADVTVNTPFGGNPSSIEVAIEVDQPFFFARVLGLDSTPVSARAVATRGETYGYSVYANQSGDCKNSSTAIDISGSKVAIEGGVHSNEELKMTSSNVYVDAPVTSLCDPHISGSQYTATGGTRLLSERQDWPVYYDYSDFGPCDFSTSGDMSIAATPEYWVGDDPSTKMLKPGVYCSQGDISLNKPASGDVTFVAKGQIDLQSNGLNLRAYQHDVVLFSEYQPSSPKGTAIHISSSTFVWEGIMLAPNGRIQFSGSDLITDAGAIFADSVKISASELSLSAPTGYVLGFPRLVE